MSEVVQSANRYDQRNVDTMKMVRGRGHWFPGGGAEVARSAAEFELRGLRRHLVSFMELSNGPGVAVPDSA